jgi:hypothetical protein
MRRRWSWIPLCVAIGLGSITTVDAAKRRAAPRKASAAPAKPAATTPAPTSATSAPATTSSTATPPASTPAATPPTRAATPPGSPQAGPSTPPAGAESPSDGDGDVTRYQFTGLDIEGELRTPALLQFLSRIGGEFETVGIPHRSFMPELSQTVTEDAL